MRRKGLRSAPEGKQRLALALLAAVWPKGCRFTADGPRFGIARINAAAIVDRRAAIGQPARYPPPRFGSLMPQHGARLSLNVRLPLLIGGLLLVAIVIFAALSYRVASRSAFAAANERLRTSADQLAARVAQQIAQSKEAIGQSAGQRVVRAFANGEALDSNAVREILRPFARDSARGNAVEIRDDSGALRLSVRPTTADDDADAGRMGPRPDSVALSELVRSGTLVLYELTAPIVRRAGPPWHLIIRQRIDGSGGGTAIASMLGNGAGIFIGNRRGNLWADMTTVADSALLSDSVRNGVYRRAGQLRLGAIAPAANTPWLMAADFSVAAVMSGTRSLLREMVGIALVVLLAGTGFGWIMSRRVTRPLRRLTQEAEALAQLEGAAPLAAGRGDELTRLSDSFDTMVTRVTDAQERLRLSEEQYRMLFDLNPNPMWVYDRETLAFMAVNGAAVEKYGYSHDEFAAMTIRDIRPPEDVPAMEKAARTDEALRPDVSQWRHRLKDGSIVDVEIRGRPLSFLGRQAELVMASDVSERNRLESRLRQSQKMEAVGRLAGGIAHDFNNILSAVLGYSNLVLEDLPADAPHREDIEEISEAGHRGAALTRQLLMFSRPQVAERQVLDINKAVGGVRKMLERIIGEDIRIETRLAEDVGRVRMDPGHLEQIVMNLAVNARDAMPEGGRLTIETADVQLDEIRHRSNRLLPAGQYVMLAVSDQGIGISKEVQTQIFEPFFTTKPPGEGTGLGLSTVYGIVQQNGGSVLVYSEPGQGATFKVYLPRVDEVPMAASPAPPPLPRDHAGETILFVEDEPSLLKVGCQILSRAGYSVIGMPGGEEAIAYAASHKGAMDLIATDMVMPGISGRELASRLRERWPGVRVLFMSGYTDDAVMQRGITEPGMAFLQKPFSGEGLTRKVRDVLDNGHPPA